MLKLGFIDQQRYQAAVEEPINASYHVQTPELNAPYIAEMARAEMVGRYGSEAYTEGYKVITTVRSDLQNAASQSVRDGLIDYDQRHGYRGPETRLPGQTRDAWLKHLGQQRSIGGLEPAIVTQVEKSGIMVMTRDGKEEAVTWDSMKWARPFLSNNSMGPMPRQPADVAQAGDQIRVQRQEDGTLRFVQIPAAQSALISLDPKDGAIRSLVGGFSSRATTTARSRPSASRAPVSSRSSTARPWTTASPPPAWSTMRRSCSSTSTWTRSGDRRTTPIPSSARSRCAKPVQVRNMVSIRVLQGLGIERAISYITKFGFQRDELPRNFSWPWVPRQSHRWKSPAPGAYSPTAATRSIRTSSNASRAATDRCCTRPIRPACRWKNRSLRRMRKTPGILVTPSIRSAEGEGSIEAQQVAAKAQTTFEPTPAERIIDARTAYIMTSMLQDVIKRGTGRRALALKRTDLAGKTGTTNDSKDGWFSGYNSDYVTSVWVGFDQPETLGRREYGGTVALPIWIRYMGFALRTSRCTPWPSRQASSACASTR